MRKAFILVMISLVVFASCDKQPQKTVLQGLAQGTYYAITYYDEQNRNFQREIDSIFHAVDMSVNLWFDSSIISKVNRNEDVTLDSIFIGNFNIAQKAAVLSDGYFDPTISPIVAAWGFSYKSGDSITPQLIDSLKKRGWVFTFIGANIDVEGTASGLGIDSHMQFDQSDEGMSSMFEADRRSRRAYSAKMNYLRRSKFFNSESAGSRRQDLGALNNGYFIEKERVAPMTIEHLGTDDIFVFFSNADGQHVDGASLYALNHFGAINGQAEGIQGKCYALPIVGNTLDDIKAAFERFNEYVVKHPQFRFILTPTGWGTADINMELIAPLFRMAYSFGNVYVPKQFLPYVDIDINF